MYLYPFPCAIKANPATSFLSGNPFACSAFDPLSLASDPPWRGRRGWKRNFGGSRICPSELLLLPMTKGPCSPTLTCPMHSSRTLFHTLIAPSQVDTKLSIVVCLGFCLLCLLSPIKWTPKLGIPHPWKTT